MLLLVGKSLLSKMSILSALLGDLGATHSNGSIKRTTGFKQTASGDLIDPLKSTQKSLFAMQLLLGVTSEFTEQETITCNLCWWLLESWYQQPLCLIVVFYVYYWNRKLLKKELWQLTVSKNQTNKKLNLLDNKQYIYLEEAGLNISNHFRLRGLLQGHLNSIIFFINTATQ